MANLIGGGRRPLPLLSTPHKGGRSALTCQFRCGNACAHDVANTTDNAYFGDVVKEALSRRGVLRAGALGALVAGVGVAGAAPALADEPEAAAAKGWTGGGNGGLNFTPVAPSTEDALRIPDGYSSSVVARWGDPVLPDAPAFDFDNQTAEAQAKQFGYNCDYVTLLPLGRDRALLWVNHEYTDESLMFRGYTGGATATEEQIKIALAAHGGSVVEIERAGNTGQWKLVTKGRRRYNRRITAQTPMRFTGPAAGSDLLKTAADPEGRNPVGMLNNCSGGTTPWGTVLTAEENIDQYFVNGDKVPEAQKPYIARYTITTGTPAGNRRFDRVEERFDLAKHPNEANRFGWIVEIDPFDPDSTPIKRTALGRLKHEAANTTLSRDNHLVVYMGDDSRFEYIYKFVSKNRYIPGFDRHNRTLLDEGTLYVAKFTGDSPAAEIDGTGKLPSDGAFDGSGEWLPLVSGDKSYVEGMTAAEVLVYTRVAADRVKGGATKMDRPEDMERNPVTGGVYVALTNNTNRTAAQVDEANPRPSNKHGHVLELVEKGNDAGQRTFAWSLPLVCGDPADPATYFAGYDKSKVSPISCPDNVTFDRDGNLWISTDGNALGSNDGLFVMPVRGKERGHLRQFLTVPVGAETCGPLVSEDQRSVFVAVQHPGEIDGASPDQPASRWPDGDQPRPAVAVVWHAKNKKIGS
ncbi:PhoX family phosphatase [Actinomadura sp. ATCC 31491]|uniref:PhoX family phosphatase n=1 Tax=Actinomadura luzonensis TaxID=2805427 RepID=A0ABT0FMS6_9ACTN|nr:PhoX family phosphatase [Actinomadura luzonensis]MCK2213642.1 PhoX family phosphatase [Actinomadura luzonensis]